jgi:hypothetical protein
MEKSDLDPWRVFNVRAALPGGFPPGARTNQWRCFADAYQQRAARRCAVAVCPDVPGISRLSRWSGAPAIETLVISWLVRLQTVTPRVLARPNDGPDH